MFSRPCYSFGTTFIFHPTHAHTREKRFSLTIVSRGVCPLWLLVNWGWPPRPPALRVFKIWFPPPLPQPLRGVTFFAGPSYTSNIVKGGGGWFKNMIGSYLIKDFVAITMFFTELKMSEKMSDIGKFVSKLRKFRRFAPKFSVCEGGF